MRLGYMPKILITRIRTLNYVWQWIALVVKGSVNRY